jgi:hypothetical protein
MAQDLTVNIKTTSDVPQAMEKAKTATNSFSKQVEDIQKKFSTSFKDIFLSFLGPMALLTGALALIGKMIADNEKKRAEANQAAIDGTNELMSAEDRYWARKNERENQSKAKAEQVVMTREQVTEEYLTKDPRGKQLWKDIQEGKSEIKPFTASWRAIKNPEVQAKVQAMIAEDMKNNPEAGAVIDNQTKDTKAGSFKGPEGFSSVVGVGANPVMEKMTRQNEILEEIKLILQEQSMMNRGGSVPGPFTERQPIAITSMTGTV